MAAWNPRRMDFEFEKMKKERDARDEARRKRRERMGMVKRGGAEGEDDEQTKSKHWNNYWVSRQQRPCTCLRASLLGVRCFPAGDSNCARCFWNFHRCLFVRCRLQVMKITPVASGPAAPSTGAGQQEERQLPQALPAGRRERGASAVPWLHTRQDTAEPLVQEVGSGVKGGGGGGGGGNPAASG